MIENLGSLSYSWNNLQKCTEITSVFWSESIPTPAYDPFGNISQLIINDLLGSTESHFIYNSKQQIVLEYGAFEHAYSYDALENRQTIDSSPTTVNELNQITQQNESSYSYDKNGNLCASSDGHLYTYDALNRLTTVTKKDDFRLSMTYDAFHRRLSKETFQWDTDNQQWTLHNSERYL